MIDTLIKIDLPKFHQHHPNPSPNVQWLVSASRDHQLTLWKFYGGHPMRRTQLNLTNSMKRQNQSSRMLMSERLSAEDYINRNNHRTTFQKDQMTSQHNKDAKSSNSSSELDDNADPRGRLEASPLVKKKVNKTHREVSQQRSGAAQLGEPSNNACEESKFDDYSQADESAINKMMEGSSPDMRFLRDRLAAEEEESPFIDHFYSVESGHKDFVRSLVQTNNNFTLITASEDKTVKLFSITNGPSVSAQNSQL